MFSAEVNYNALDEMKFNTKIFLLFGLDTQNKAMEFE